MSIDENDKVEEPPTKRQKVEESVSSESEVQIKSPKKPTPVKSKKQSSSDSSVKIVEVREGGKICNNLKSLSSSLNNSQAVEIKNKLGIGAKTEEFSFNDGNMQDCSQGLKMSSQSLKKSSQRGARTLRPTPPKEKKKSSGGNSQKQDPKEVDILTESSNEREIKKHTSGNDGPSWTKSYQGASQCSQISNRSNVDELFKSMTSRQRNRRGRHFISRNSAIMHMTFSQSQTTSRVGSAMNSRIGSTKGTPKGNKSLHPAHRLDKTDKSPNVDTPAHANRMAEQSRSIYDSLRKQSHKARLSAQTEIRPAPPQTRVNQQNPKPMMQRGQQFKMPMTAGPRPNAAGFKPGAGGPPSRMQRPGPPVPARNLGSAPRSPAPEIKTYNPH